MTPSYTYKTITAADCRPTNVPYRVHFSYLLLISAVVAALMSSQLCPPPAAAPRAPPPGGAAVRARDDVPYVAAA